MGLLSQHRRQLLTIILVLCGLSPAAAGETRTWKGQSGDSVKAEFTGVLNGQVVLKQGRTRLRHPITDFSLADRDYIVERLKGKVDKVRELLQAAALTKPSESLTEVTFYGFKLPSIGMIDPPPAHEFSDLAGNKISASFERLLPPYHVQLDANGRSQTFPLVSFITSDIEFIRGAIEQDMEKEVFPANASMTGSGRIFTDRRGVQMMAKFVRRVGKQATFDVDGVEESFPYYGLSNADQQYIEAQSKRSKSGSGEGASGFSGAGGGMGAGRFRGGAFGSSGIGSPGYGSGMEDSMGEGAGGGMGAGGMGAGYMPDGGDEHDGGESSFGSSGFGGPGSSSFGSSGGSSFPSIPGAPKYEFECDECGHEWTSITGISHCPNCKDNYKFHCDECGHNWTLKNQSVSTCPNCTGRTDSGGTGFGFSSNSGGSTPSSRSSAYRSGRRIGGFVGVGSMITLLLVFFMRKVFN